MNGIREKVNRHDRQREIKRVSDVSRVKMQLQLLQNKILLDLEKAYNHVPWGILWGLFQEYVVPGPLL